MDKYYNLGNTKFHSSDIVEEKPKTTVYILKKDKEICGVFSTIEKAREFALNYIREICGGIHLRINTEYSYSYNFSVENDIFAWDFFIDDFILDDVIDMR